MTQDEFKPVPARRRRILVRGVAGLVLAWLAFAGWITWAGCETRLRPADCIVVLGARSLADGTPGASLEGRCRRALELWREGWAPVLLFTGGRGETGTVEGEVGAAWARARGVPAEALVIEDRSHTTRENLEFAAAIMRKRGWSRCLVVTDPFHIPRAMALARDAGLQADPAPTFAGPAWRKWNTWAWYTFRETFAWVKYAWPSPAPGPTG